GQIAKLESVSDQFAKELKPAKPHLVAVADFSSPDGSASGSCHYLAGIVSQALELHGKKFFHVAEHTAFDKDLIRISASLAVSVSQVQQGTAANIGADVLITGTIVKREQSLLLENNSIEDVESYCACVPAVQSASHGIPEQSSKPFHVTRHRTEF